MATTRSLLLACLLSTGCIYRAPFQMLDATQPVVAGPALGAEVSSRLCRPLLFGVIGLKRNFNYHDLITAATGSAATPLVGVTVDQEKVVWVVGYSQCFRLHGWKLAAPSPDSTTPATPSLAPASAPRAGSTATATSAGPSTTILSPTVQDPTPPQRSAPTDPERTEAEAVLDRILTRLGRTWSGSTLDRAFAVDAVVAALRKRDADDLVAQVAATAAGLPPGTPVDVLVRKASK